MSCCNQLKFHVSCCIVVNIVKNNHYVSWSNITMLSHVFLCFVLNYIVSCVVLYCTVTKSIHVSYCAWPLSLNCGHDMRLNMSHDTQITTRDWYTYKWYIKIILYWWKPNQLELRLDTILDVLQSSRIASTQVSRKSLMGPTNL